MLVTSRSGATKQRTHMSTISGTWGENVHRPCDFDVRSLVGDMVSKDYHVDVWSKLVQTYTVNPKTRSYGDVPDNLKRFHKSEAYISPLCSQSGLVTGLVREDKGTNGLPKYWFRALPFTSKRHQLIASFYPLIILDLWRF